jgi:C1A family cysteine protease
VVIPLNPDTEAKLRELGYEPDPSWVQVSYADEHIDLPKEFDLRTNYSKCIHLIPDEGKCIGSWALVSASVLSDRLCMKTNGTTDFSLSGQELLNCAKDGKGCAGGEVGRIAFEYLTSYGVSLEQCQPWVSGVDGKEKDCKQTCDNGTYKAYKCAKVIFEMHEDDIKAEILKNGPVDCRFEFYEDFNDYKSGIYYRVSTHKLYSNHAAKVIGWSEENSIKFWNLENSWGKVWGENGYFRMKNDESGICKIAVTCEPGST